MLTIRRGLLKKYSSFFSATMCLLDVFFVFLSSALVFLFQVGAVKDITLSYVFTTLCAGMLFLVFAQLFGLYQSYRGQLVLGYIQKLFFVVAATFLGIVVFLFLLKFGSEVSRVWVLAWMLLAYSLLLLLRMAVYFLLAYMRVLGLNERRVVLVGGGVLGLEMARRIQRSFWTGFRIVAVYDDFKMGYDQAMKIKIEKTPGDFLEKIKMLEADEVWLALPNIAAGRVSEILHELKYETITIRQMLDIYGVEMVNASLTDLMGMPVLNLKITPMLGFRGFLKLIEDRFLATVILILISPIMALIAILVKLTSPGPVFYKQTRVSWNGEVFQMLKFRSMCLNAEHQTGPVWTKKNDSRVTRLGGFLRKTSLDELPQFLNVLKGDMSIVGPRPERPEFVEKFKGEIPNYMQKHLVKAGITGWAQIHGWRGDTSLKKRIEYDLYYIENYSLLLDLRIIFFTFFKGFVNKNAY